MIDPLNTSGVAPDASTVFPDGVRTRLWLTALASDVQALQHEQAISFAQIVRWAVLDPAQMFVSNSLSINLTRTTPAPCAIGGGGTDAR
jgi:hypothetical protein